MRVSALLALAQPVTLNKFEVRGSRHMPPQAAHLARCNCDNLLSEALTSLSSFQSAFSCSINVLYLAFSCIIDAS